MKNKPLVTGIIAVASPVPVITFTVFWYWMWFFGIGMSLFGYNTVPVWIDICGFLPFFVSPALCVAGIVHGAIKHKCRLAWLGILLSVVGLIENFIIVYTLYYIGSTF